MAQLLIYKTAVPVSRARHSDCFIEVGNNYAFSGEINSVPLMAVEFPQAANEYAIVFAGPEGGDLTPAVLLGVRGNENLFLSGPSGEWSAKYVPAFLRRYPFVFSQNDDRFLLCVDEEYGGLNREGRGQPLFDAEGKPSPYVDNILKFLQEYQTQFLRTQAFCKKIKELDLLEPMQAQVTTEAGGRVALGGFQAVSRTKLKALPGDKLAELAATDELELLYLHLQSMRNFDGLRERLEHVLEAEKPAEAASGGNGADSPSVH
ncbi:MAG: SapC family protein [Acetobacteraceae bacterium]